ncbi:Thiamine pyrophosphate-requiring enzyme [Caenispirillum salinarum AK4]|uniref:Thiamine pyrophosphate-requiring enzyme n=1 Tax=Caenispirillum salinarum AK4 TaxID=1238182 RepID=K9H2J9_9PROT|nr:thiamine pyrophosphate-binding protein [Caenispirillum salinarum]EKV31279.1 Thiamine pyrophosphate-requiring enzyme [Caenispirillum salinarum AK4]
MSAANTPRSGGRILVDELVRHGVDTAYCVPGESYLAVLDALHDATVRVITARQEGGAAFMAEAHGKMTGRPGICFVTRGPGATNASIGVHTAFQDSTPMILFVGQVARDQMEREAFQEIDYRRMYGEMTKWVAQIDDARRIPEFVSRAFHTATAGRPGPVVLALPEDMLRDVVEAPEVAPFRTPVQPHISSADLMDLRDELSHARRPFMILGGGGWTPKAVKDIQQFAERQNLPVGCSFRTQHLFDNDHPLYAGDVGIGINPALAERIKASDLLIVVGARLGEMTTGGYEMLKPPKLPQHLVHVHPGAEELGRVFQPDLAINCGMESFAHAASSVKPVSYAAREDWAKAARADYEAWNDPTPVTTPGTVQMGAIMAWLREHLPKDAVMCNGAGNYSVWVHRFHRYRGFRTQAAPTNGTMGYGVPAAVAVKAANPERTVVAFAGDGCFQMNGQELGTAVQFGLPFITIVVNNGMYGTIRMHQERTYPGRISATDLVNPDFVMLAKAYGCHAELVEKTEDFAPAFQRAEASGKPALIEVRIDPEAITPRETLSGIREKASAKA